jgi:hypothetical protein
MDDELLSCCVLKKGKKAIAGRVEGCHSRVSEYTDQDTGCHQLVLMPRLSNPPGCQIGYMEYTGCHRLNRALTAK